MFSVDDIIGDEFRFTKKMSDNILNWNVDHVQNFLKSKFESNSVVNAVLEEKIDGKTLLLLNERDLYALESKYSIKLGDLKRLVLIINKLQSENRNCLVYLGLLDNQSNLINTLVHNPTQHHYHHHQQSQNIISERNRLLQDVERISPANSVDGSNSGNNPVAFATCKPEFFKTVVSLGKCVLITCQHFKSINVNFLKIPLAVAEKEIFVAIFSVESNVQVYDT